MEAKSIFKSKTMWFNVLTVLVAVATVFDYTPNQELFEATSAFLVTLSPVINMVLRYVTKQPVKVL